MTFVVASEINPEAEFGIRALLTINPETYQQNCMWRKGENCDN